MIRNVKTLALVGVIATSCISSFAAQAGSMLGLVEGKWIVTIDPNTRKVAKGVDIKGAGKLIGIDVRPADGLLYGVTADGWIVTIDPQSGQASQKSKLSEMLKSGVIATVDELVALAPELGALDRRVCRREAQRRFSDRVMADGYEQVYKRVIAERQSDELALTLGVGNGRMPMTA